MKKLILIFLFLCINLYAQDPAWIIRGEMPIPVAGAASAVHNGNIYVLGGYSSITQNNVDYIQKYNPSLTLWKIIAHMKNSRFGLWGGVESDSVYYFGGLTDTVANASTLELWNIGTSVSTEDTNINFNRIFSSAILDNDRIFIFGGNSSGDAGIQKIPYIVEYRIPSKDIGYQNDTLYVGGDLPEQQMIAKKGNYIYLFGGVINGISNRIFRFDILTNSFERLPVNLLEPRAGGRAVLDYSNGQIYIIGGYNENSSALSSVEVFNDYYGAWFEVQQGPPLNYGRTYPIAEYVNGYLYVLGGYNVNNEPETAIEILSASVTGFSENSYPAEYELMQNYPNPFNPETNISFTLPHNEFVSLDIYNTLGEKVTNLISGNIERGTHNVKWDGKNNRDDFMPSGIYLLKFSSNSFSATKKMMLLR